MLDETALRTPMPLRGVVQRYDWGSPTQIPKLLGADPDGQPVAELWFGAHRRAPSSVRLGGEDHALDTLVQRAPTAMLGDRVADQFGPRLPFLLKVLAADRALSLQVHPKPHLARAGFNRENRLGIAPDSPERSFHDDQHKPEMVVALTEFDGLAGFRTPRNVLQIIDGIKGDLIARVRAILSERRDSSALSESLEVLISARREGGCSGDIELSVGSVRDRIALGSPFERADRTVIDLAEQHPGDPGVLASLLLNRFSLNPGESIFLPPGEVHAYLSGLVVEVMASSDNVLRAGLTTKRIDTDALLECASFAPRAPVIPMRTVTGRSGEIVCHDPAAGEFVLWSLDVAEGHRSALPGHGPRVVLGLDGKTEIVPVGPDSKSLTIGRGDAALIPDAAGPVDVLGSGHLVCVAVP